MKGDEARVIKIKISGGNTSSALRFKILYLMVVDT